MSKYVMKKHGLMIGSDNVFFYKETPDDPAQLFRAIVRALPYRFDNLTVETINVRTPANQIIWKEGVYEFTDTVTLSSGRGVEITSERHVHTLQPDVRFWLNANAPGWGVAPDDKADRSPAIFFKKRSHALAFTRWIDSLLDGMTYR